MTRKRLICCCCPIEQNESIESLIDRVADIPPGLGPLFTTSGVSPYFVQQVDHEFFLLNNYEEEELEAGGGCKATRYPDDPLYMPDPRSDCSAFTPVYRANQRWVFNIFDAWSDHGLDVSYSGTPAQWYDWDGIEVRTIWSPSSLSSVDKQQYRKDWYDWVFPNRSGANFSIRGLKQLYDMSPPFVDTKNPTVREFEIWNDRVLNLFRQLCGLNSAIPLQELYIMCAWSNERKATDIWNAYGGTLDSAYGPCQGGNNLHCGTTFKPIYAHQKPYWNSYYCNFPCGPDPNEITLNQGSEAITTWYNGNATHAMSRFLRHLMGLAANGNAIGGHSGTFAFRQFYGIRSGRSKWTGALQSPPAGYSV